jgi:hypothetical protein
MAPAIRNSVRAKRIKERAERRRAELWPDLETSRVWDRNTSHGFSTIPRSLVLIGTIADTLAEKNKRVSTVYFALWCRVWDVGLVIIDNEYEAATEAGFTGERRIYTWRDRIKQLANIGLIDVKEGPKGPYQFIMIFNPYQVLYDIHASNESSIQPQYWTALIERADDVGAQDIVEYKALLEESRSKKKR